MKKLLLLLAIGIAIPNCQAQDPDLFRTWYLYEILPDDLNDLYVVAEIDPLITPPPTMTINESLEIHATGACNTYDGTYEIQSGGNEFVLLDSFRTTDDCGFQIHNSFETGYFDFLKYFWYTIDSDSVGQTLYLENVFFGYALLKSYPLSTEDFKLNNISIFPNPASEELFLSTNTIQIESLKVRSMFGQLVMEHKGYTNSIDVSQLSTGVYIMEISTTEGRAFRRFIKE